MEEHKKRVLIIIGFILVFIALIAILLGIIFKDEEKKPSTNPSNTEKPNVISKEIELLKNDSLFFSLQNVISNYYNLLYDKNTDELLRVLDQEYVLDNNISSSNIYSILGSNIQSFSYIAKNIYYNPNSSITYYFVNGYFTDSSILDDEDYSLYLPNINYLIIVDNKSNYVIKPLGNDVSIENFAKSYNIEDKKINSNKYFAINNISEKAKLNTYINEFLNLMVYDTNRAYNMLDDSTKNKYASLEDFESQIVDTYNKLSSSVFAYGLKEIDGIKEYNIKDNKQNNITIYETNTMNYKIKF